MKRLCPNCGGPRTRPHHRFRRYVVCLDCKTNVYPSTLMPSQQEVAAALCEVRRAKGEIPSEEPDWR